MAGAERRESKEPVDLDAPPRTLASAANGPLTVSGEMPTQALNGGPPVGLGEGPRYRPHPGWADVQHHRQRLLDELRWRLLADDGPAD
jgi:hypothetical protein